MSEYETILLDVDDHGVAWLTFNRPEKRNALDLAMVQDVRAALRKLEGDEAIAALVFQGAGGKAFISGADIGQLRDRTHADALRRINSDLFREIERFPAPTIASIQGFALGGGCELAIACDLRVAGESAKLGQPEVGLGIIPAAGATYRLPRLVGLGRARELVFTGRILSASEALAIGLVEQVVPDGALADATAALAQSIAKNSRLAVRLAKQSLNQSLVASLDALQALESSAQGILFDDPEKHRRMTAFLDARERRRAAKKGKAASESAPAAQAEAPERGGPSFDVRGAVAAPRAWSYAELEALGPDAQVDDVSTLVPGREGRAVRLSALFAVAQPKGAHAEVRADDSSFTATKPLGELERGLVLYQRKGAPLGREYGGPFRLLIPDCEDRCANVKQLGTIEVLAY